jgi:hypothetical protein
MRLRVGAAMPLKGGRPALIAVEVTKAGRDSRGREAFDFLVGHIERVMPTSVEKTSERLLAIIRAVEDVRPCMIIDAGSPQGLALYQNVRGSGIPPALHKPHAYPGTGQRTGLFASFLQSYSEGRIRFEPGLKHRGELDRSLVFYMGGGTKTDGVELSSEDEALVIALGLAMSWPRHGGASGQHEAP